MRFVSAQFVALLEGDLWIRSARHANAMAARLAAAVRDLPGVTITQPVQANAVFAIVDPADVEPAPAMLGVTGGAGHRRRRRRLA
jgi:threonine aldolase